MNIPTLENNINNYYLKGRHKDDGYKQFLRNLNMNKEFLIIHPPNNLLVKRENKYLYQSKIAPLMVAKHDLRAYKEMQVRGDRARICVIRRTLGIYVEIIKANEECKSHYGHYIWILPEMISSPSFDIGLTDFLLKKEDL